MKKLLLSLAMCLCIASQGIADTVYYTADLSVNSPTFDAPNASGAGSALQYYNAAWFTVSANGNYTFETSSVNTTGTPSNALDTFFVLYANTFDPNNPNTQLITQDDYTGLLTVLPGPYTGNGVTGNATGFTGAQPSSRILDFALTAGTQYFLINTSFRDTTFVSTNAAGQAVGTYYTGITGPGTITVTSIPEPGSLALLGMAGLVFGIRRRRQG